MMNNQYDSYGDGSGMGNAGMGGGGFLGASQDGGSSSQRTPRKVL